MSKSSSSSSSGGWFDKVKGAANSAAVATKKAAVYVADQSKQTYDNLRAPPSQSQHNTRQQHRRDRRII
jgi:hypothetical protein